MFSAISDFAATWRRHFEKMQKLFETLTDQSLAQEVTPGHRTLGRMAWHIVTTIPEMAGRTGLQLDGPAHDVPVPSTAAEIAKGYATVAKSLLEQVEKSWTDQTLQVEDDMYGEQWKRGMSLTVIIIHEVHHGGQMTVLMRQAGLPVPGLYGPSYEEWGKYGAPPPEI
ncbi:MAG: DinB family protein [candidate division Zixibacteria bacterium]|nr:DinB family protein [candidate division Zixibacteria bacterium]